MTRGLSHKLFVQRVSPTTRCQHRVAVTSVNLRSRFHHASILSDSRSRFAGFRSTNILERGPDPSLADNKPVPQWQKSEVWRKIFSPYWHERYEPSHRKASRVPLWDLAPGCIMFFPNKSTLSPHSHGEIEKYGSLDMCGHYVLVLAVDIKGPNEGTVGVTMIRTFSQHEEQCRFFGLDWFDSTHFEIGRATGPQLPSLRHNMKKVRLYINPLTRVSIYNYKRRFIETNAIFTVPYQELRSEAVFLGHYWWPSAALDAWNRRVIKEDFMQICETIGFTPDPWHSSGPYMWKNFVEKTGIDTCGFDLEDPALYDEKAFYRQMWETEPADDDRFLRLQDQAHNAYNDYSPLGWQYDRIPYVAGLVNTSRCCRLFRRMYGML